MYVSQDLKEQALAAKLAGLNGDKEALIKHINSVLSLVEVVEGMEKFNPDDENTEKEQGTCQTAH